MKKDPEAHSKFIWSLISNARRLADDATVLCENESYASGYLLAVLAIEEIGRVILSIWERDRPLPKPSRWISYHVKKQTAVAYLIGIPTGNSLYDTIIGEDDDFDSVNVGKWISDFANHPDTKWIISANCGELESTRQAGIYVSDELPYFPAATKEMIADSVKRVARAYLILRGKHGQPNDIWQARRFYELWLTGQTL